MVTGWHSAGVDRSRIVDANQTTLIHHALQHLAPLDPLPAFAAKAVIVLHVLAYGLLQFVFKEQVSLHFLHLYALLFVVEVLLMLLLGLWRPQQRSTEHFPAAGRVDLQPWPYAVPCAVTLISCVAALYLLFSPLGLVGGTSVWFLPSLAALLTVSLGCWGWQYRILKMRAAAGVMV